MDETTKLMDEILLEAIQKNASDIHLTVGVPPVLRINSRLTHTQRPMLKPPDTKELAYSIMSEEQAKRLAESGELDFSYSIPQISRFRVNVYKQRGSIAVAIRVVNDKIPSFEELGLPEVLRSLALKQRGLVLVTGPTGSGKSTTLAAMINHINQNRSSHIITIEDPIEYLHRHNQCIINQRELHADTQSFALALRAALREDPDVILLGEMRDIETISAAITAAETGHLVFATLHTSDSAQTIDRIIDVFPAAQQAQIKVQLALTLNGIVAQQLMPRKDGKGRVAAFEVLLNNPAVRNLIREGKTHQISSFIQTGAKIGMQSMDSCLRDLYMSGKITYEEAVTHALDPELLERIIQGF